MICAVILAAGASTRMGTQKLLLPLGGEPLVRRAVRQVCDAGFDDVLVVLGTRRERHSRRSTGCRFVMPSMQSTPAAWAARSARRSSTLATARPPCLPSPTSHSSPRSNIGSVLDTYRRHAPAIVSVRYGDVMGPPHLFEREFFPELAELQHGARPVLLRHQRPDDGAAVSTRYAGGYRYARGLRARQEPPVFGRDEGCRPSRSETLPGIRVESREDFAENGHGHFFRRFRAERESHRTSHSRETQGRRHEALSGDGRQQLLVP